MPAEAPSDGPRPATGLDESSPRFVGTAEGRVAYHEAGDGEPALVILHGFTGHRDDFIGILPTLGERRRVLAPDLRGHGDSETGPGALGWSFEQLVNDLLAFLDAMGLERIDLLGHSVGGFVALRTALRAPERIRSLVLMCTAPETPSAMDPTGWQAAVAISAERGMDGLIPLAERAMRNDPFPGLAAWGDVERYYAHHRRRHASMTPESYREVGATFFESESLVAQLREVEMPALVLVGAQDHEWLPGADLFEQHLPAARRITIDGAEHHPHQENRAAFLEALETHLSGLEQVGQGDAN
ncbi:MAG: alpha/beta hydrolase [bacterium]|nr:alpha/beta hydrolase [bacterium]